MDDRTAEEWGRVAADLPGFRWLAGMRQAGQTREYRCTWCTLEPDFVNDDDEREDLGDGEVMWFRRVFTVDAMGAPGWGWPSIGSGWAPDPDDPATAGCLLSLLGDVQVQRHPDGEWEVGHKAGAAWGYGTTIGRACIAVAEALGRWPGAPDAR